MMDIVNRPKLALLIDAQNITACKGRKILKESHKLGNPIVRQLYADWSQQDMQKWLETSTEFGLSLVQTPVSGGKNAADIAMTIAAMDIVHTRSVGGIIIASSDSDFTALAVRIRDAGFPVFGIGWKLQRNLTETP